MRQSTEWNSTIGCWIPESDNEKIIEIKQREGIVLFQFLLFVKKKNERGDFLAGNFNYNNPDDFNKDEEKWFKFFTLWSLLSTIAFGVVGWFTIRPLFALFNQEFIGVVITLIFAFLGYAIVSFEIPVSSKIPGAGHKPITIIFRRCARRTKRVIYVKGYGEYEDFDNESEEWH